MPLSEFGLAALPRSAAEDPFAASCYSLEEPGRRAAAAEAAQPREPSLAGTRDDTRHPGFDVHGVRNEFPVLAERLHGRPLVWLDNGATTQKPTAVLERLDYFYRHENS